MIKKPTRVGISVQAKNPPLLNHQRDSWARLVAVAAFEHSRLLNLIASGRVDLFVQPCEQKFRSQAPDLAALIPGRAAST